MLQMHPLMSTPYTIPRPPPRTRGPLSVGSPVAAGTNLANTPLSRRMQSASASTLRDVLGYSAPVHTGGLSFVHSRPPRSRGHQNPLNAHPNAEPSANAKAGGTNATMVPVRTSRSPSVSPSF